MEIKCSTCNKMHEAHPLVDKTGYVTICPDTGLCEVHNCGCYHYSYVKDNVYISGSFVGFEKDLKDLLLSEKSTSYYKMGFNCGSHKELEALIVGGMV